MSATASDNNDEPFNPSIHRNEKIEFVNTMMQQKHARQVRERRKLESEVYCRPQIHYFATCMGDHFLSAPFACKTLHRKMLQCLHEYLDYPLLNIQKPNFNRHLVFDKETESASYLTPQEQEKFDRDIEQYKSKYKLPE